MASDVWIAIRGSAICPSYLGRGPGVIEPAVRLCVAVAAERDPVSGLNLHADEEPLSRVTAWMRRAREASPHERLYGILLASFKKMQGYEMNASFPGYRLERAHLILAESEWCMRSAISKANGFQGAAGSATSGRRLRDFRGGRIATLGAIAAPELPAPIVRSLNPVEQVCRWLWTRHRRKQARAYTYRSTRQLI
jgi:hypothetical protein